VWRPNALVQWGQILSQPVSQLYCTVPSPGLGSLSGQIKMYSSYSFDKRITLMLAYKNVGYSQNISNRDVNYWRTCTSLWQLWLPYTVVTVRSRLVGHNIFGRSLLGPWQATGNGTDTRASHLWRPSSIPDQYMCAICGRVNGTDTGVPPPPQNFIFFPVSTILLLLHTQSAIADAV